MLLIRCIYLVVILYQYIDFIFSMMVSNQKNYVLMFIVLHQFLVFLVSFFMVFIRDEFKIYYSSYSFLLNMIETHFILFFFTVTSSMLKNSIIYSLFFTFVSNFVLFECENLNLDQAYKNILSKRKLSIINVLFISVVLTMIDSMKNNGITLNICLFIVYLFHSFYINITKRFIFYFRRLEIGRKNEEKNNFISIVTCYGFVVNTVIIITFVFFFFHSYVQWHVILYACISIKLLSDMIGQMENELEIEVVE